MPAGQHSLTITRTLEASVEEVWAAWTDPEQLGAWMAADPWELVEISIDMRTGGEYKVGTKAPDGNVFTFFGRYEELVPNERLVQVGGMTGPGGVVLMDNTTLVVSLRALGPAVTELTLVNSGLESAEVAIQFREGWETGGLKDLEAFLASRRASV